MPKHIEVKEGRWYHFARKDGLVCCDCGLVHNLTFGIKQDGDKRKIYIKFKRDERATSAYRRGKAMIASIKKLLK